MSQQHETNPHFLSRQNDPSLEFPPQTRRPRHEPPPRRSSRTRAQPPLGPGTPHRPPQPAFTPPYHVDIPPPQRYHEHAEHDQIILIPPRPTPQAHLPPHPPHPTPHAHSPPHHATVPPWRSHDHTTPDQTSLSPRHPTQHHEEVPPQSRRPSQTSHRTEHPSLLRGPPSQKTRPLAWLVAAFCALFWVIIIVGGLVILTVYLLFRPRNPKFDISAASFNAAYLDMGYLLNADITLLANFSNPNTKVNVDFSYAILDLYYEKTFIATRYVAPFSLMRSESMFADVHFMVSQVRLSMGHIMKLKRQMDSGRVNFQIEGLFRTRSKLGGVFQYSYWLYAHCQIVVTGPPTGILLEKKCVTKR